jgi:hypothetical protein
MAFAKSPLLFECETKYIISRHDNSIPYYKLNYKINVDKIKRETATQYAFWIHSASQLFDVDPEIVMAVASYESAFINWQGLEKPTRRSFGIMRMQSRTATECMEFLKKEGEYIYEYLPELKGFSRLSGKDLIYNPKINIYLGTYHLRRLLEKNNFDLEKALMIYNGGAEGIKKPRVYKKTVAYKNAVYKEMKKYLKSCPDGGGFCKICGTSLINQAGCGSCE